MSKSVKNIINLRNISFNKGDITRSRELQKEVKRELKLAKIRYKNSSLLVIPDLHGRLLNL